MMWTWSWILAVVGSFGLFTVGSKLRWGWFVLICNEFLWVIYALQSKQYGFIMYSFLYVAMYIRAMYKWDDND